MKATWRTVVAACALSTLTGCGPSEAEKQAAAAEQQAERQLQAVVEKLIKLNPKFFAFSVKHKIENGVVTELDLSTPVSDISPLRELTELKVLLIWGGDKDDLSDISPLKAMKKLT